MVTGVQQVGIGVTDVETAWKWYRKWFGLDVQIFDDEAEAKLMVQYTGGEVHTRRAAMALNMQGGGGVEIWQFKSRTPQPPAFKILPGDLGINVVKLKSSNVKLSYDLFKSDKNIPLSELISTPDHEPTFYVKDPNGNIFQFVESHSWFNLKHKHCGGSCGVIIGVSDMNKALEFYKTLLDNCLVIYDKTDLWNGMPGVTEQKLSYRRVLLRKNFVPMGAFSELLGHIDIELVQCVGRQPRKIFENRFWGDLGFIHLCLDVFDMDKLKAKLAGIGKYFTVDSANSFDMGEAAGRFTYTEDPDGTLIEFVETHKVPIMKKWNWYINVKTSDEAKPLPRWMVKCLGFNRVKD
jgi:catechol 2,3-dioxygenase-like lactoylglutathione lyase family enzyme